MDTGRTPRALRWFATLVLFTALAGQAWRNLITWWGYVPLAALLAIAAVVILIAIRPPRRPGTTWATTPKTLALFLGLATVSLAWSFYPGASALGLLAQWSTTAAALALALCLRWRAILIALAAAFRWIIGLSLLFELVVAIFVRHPVLPLWVDYGNEKIPDAFYWSRALLFDGGRIQGILGNSNLLAMCALLAVIVFGVQLAERIRTDRARAERTVGQAWAIVWLALSVITLALTRSSTVIAATLVTAAVLLAALWVRSIDPAKRNRVYLTAAAVVAASVATVLVFSAQLLSLLGKGEDLTGRVEIWRSVTHLAGQRPVFGWGWVSYWPPWAEPFHNLAIRKGVTYLQAHNAWLDVWLQVGIVGLVIFAALVASTLWRSWFLAVDRPRTGLDDRAPFTALSLLPLLVIAALIAQSAAESRILDGAGWLLLVLLAAKTKQHARGVEDGPHRDTPVTTSRRRPGDTMHRP